MDDFPKHFYGGGMAGPVLAAGSCGSEGSPIIGSVGDAEPEEIPFSSAVPPWYVEHPLKTTARHTAASISAIFIQLSSKDLSYQAME